MRTFMYWTALTLTLLACKEADRPDIRRALNESILAWQKDDAASAFAILDRTIATYDAKKYPEQMEPIHKLRLQYEAQYRDRYAAERSYYPNRRGVAGAIYDEIILYHREQQRYPEHLNELEVFNSLPEPAREACEYEKAALFEAGFVLNCSASNTEMEVYTADTGHPTIWTHYESQQKPANSHYAPAPNELYAPDSGLRTQIREHTGDSSMLDDFCNAPGRKEGQAGFLPCPQPSP